MSSETIGVLEARTFVGSDRMGDKAVAPYEPQGLFYCDTPVLLLLDADFERPSGRLYPSASSPPAWSTGAPLLLLRLVLGLETADSELPVDARLPEGIGPFERCGIPWVRANATCEAVNRPATTSCPAVPSQVLIRD